MSRMGALAAQDGYDPNVFDVPLDQGTNVGWANRLGEGLMGGVLRMLETPGAMMKPNPYPPGSEEAAFFDASKKSAMVDWAPGMALNTMGAGGIAGVPVKGTEAVFGSGAIRRAPELAMDEASRLARATEQGFTRDAYRGEGRPIEGSSFIERHPGRYDPGFLGGDAIYATNRPHLANDYATIKAAREFDEGAPNVMPLKVKMEKPLTITSDDKRRIAAMDRWDRDAWLQDEVYGKGHDGVIVKYGGGDPAKRSSGYEEYVAPAASYRSRFAAFDPANKGSDFLLGSGATDKKLGKAILGVEATQIEKRTPKQASKTGFFGKILAPEEELAPKYPQYATEYPPTGPGVPTIDPKSGKPYMAKSNTPQAEEFAADRNLIQKDMDTKGYKPYFDPAERFHADPAQYPPMLDTAQALPKKMETIEKWTHELDTPETRAALQRMYKAGQQVPNAENWYMMGQLEREYIKELGPQIGRERFRTDFGGAMAATTGGADPTTNFLMGHYANYLRYKGQDFPRVSAAENAQVKAHAESQGKEYVDKKGRPIDKTGDIASYALPFPIGGQYASVNLDQYSKVFKEVARGKDIAKALEDSNQKRLNFMQAFTGDPHSFTWDKQMTTGATANKYDMPPGDAYGIMERVAREEAAKAGVPAQNFQDVGWAGQKAMLEGAKPLGGKFQGPTGVHNFKYEGPMISHINDVIERTHRLTGMPKEEIVRRGLVRAEIPLYGIAGATTMGGLAAQDRYNQEERL